VTDTPDDALIEAIARAIDEEACHRLDDCGVVHGDVSDAMARAAYAAIVDHLGLEWWNSVKDMLAGEPQPRRRLMSKWQKVGP
jgi:hypothetical protein